MNPLRVSWFSPPLPPGEGAGGRGLRGKWFVFGVLCVFASLCELIFAFCFKLTAES